ncbi:COG4705 family protein [Brevibacillus fluminis]|uniref:COG4705 family protein n=1 Tax=Brevibacillus fluminis TaxID=511487 RepID=UPI003F8C20CA
MELNQSKMKMLRSKVPEVTIFFWIIKVLCTTVGETFADFLNFNLGFGLTFTTVVMGIVFLLILFVQFRATKYVPSIYWITVVLISVCGTLVTDNLTDNVGVPLETSTAVFSVLLGLTFLFWYRSEKTLSIHSIYTRKREVFYWLTILFTFALGTAVGDLFSEQLGLGYLYTGITVVLISACVFVAWKFLKLDGILAFWIVYILTRPLGASLGDYLSQATNNGGLGLGTTVTSVIFLIAILAIIVFLAVTKYDSSAKTGATETQQTYENKKNVLVQTVVVLCMFVAVGIGGYVGLNNQITAQTASAQASFVGQLRDFIQIEKDMLANVNANDFASAKQGADNLEHQWDVSEPTLRKIDGTTWTKIDETIDIVLAAVRSGSPDASQCKSALAHSLSTLTEANQMASQTDPSQSATDSKSQADSTQTTTDGKSQADSTQTTTDGKSQAGSTQTKTDGKTQADSAKTALHGKLTEFVTIENDMMSKVNAKDFASAKKGADNLEHQWDLSEPTLRKIDGTTWTKIDETIDDVLAAVRTGSPDASQCKSALTHSLSIINQANQ